MDMLSALAKTLAKMFAADLGLTVSAVAVVVLIALGLAGGVLAPAVAPWLLAAGVLGALVFGVVRGAAGSR